MRTIRREYIDQSLDYAGYRARVEERFAMGQTTSSDHRPHMLDYTRINMARMNRLDRTARITEEATKVLEGLDRSLYWLVLTEGWCGDAAQVIPVLAKMAERTERIELRLLMRDAHPELMDRFLTEKSRSIPKLVIVDRNSLEVLGTWGPRPAELQQQVLEAKAIREKAPASEQDLLYREALTHVQRWYNQDKTRSVQKEVVILLQQVNARRKSRALGQPS